MTFRTGSIAREIGSAVAVLAVYLLVLLAPLHQAAGLQQDLSELGYSSVTNWSICASNIVDDGEDDTVAIKCPVAGVGKYEFAAIAPGTVDLDPARVAARTYYFVALAHAFSGNAPHFGQARAPPATV
jgi:hypothetical protein